MDELEVVRVLNKYNPWWSNKPIPAIKVPTFKRGDFHFLKKSLNLKVITSIIGPRRVGKTVLIHQIIQSLLDKGVDPRKILYLSVDDMDLSHGEVQLNKVLEIYSKYIIREPISELKTRHYLFLDEIQEIKDWEKIMKNWQDFGFNIKFTISGSSSIWITKGTEESLLGRIKTSVVLPLKFSEVLRYRGIIPDVFFKHRMDVQKAMLESIEKKDPKVLYSELKKFIGKVSGSRSKIEIELDRYLTVGGYPEFLEEQDHSFISEMMRDKIKLIFFKDVVRYFRIRNPSVLEDLFRLLAKNSGGFFNLANNARILGIERPTLKEYLKYLTKAYLIKSSEFHSESRNKRIRKQDKVYVLDPGIRNAAVDYLDDTLLNDPSEVGKVVEGVLFDHLTRLKHNLEPGPEPSVDYWINGKEIDFILRIKRKSIPVEAKYRSRIPKETHSAIQDFVKLKKSPFGLIVTKNEFSLNKNILEVPLWVILLLI